MTEEELGKAMLAHEREAQKVRDARALRDARLIEHDDPEPVMSVPGQLVIRRSRQSRRLLVTPLGVSTYRRLKGDGLSDTEAARELGISNATMQAVKKRQQEMTA